MVKNELSKRIGFKTHSKASGIFLFLLLMTILVQAQSKTITGKVIDQETQYPVPGVTIIEKGTKNGATTDFDGAYTIDVAGPESSLQFSYIGYATQSISVASGNVFDIVLESNISELDQVVVIGYGAVKKRDLTGSVSVVGEKDFNRGIVTSPDQLIQGRAAGVQVVNNSGQPGGAATVRIRGNSSIRSGNEPLYVVDGVQLSNNSGKPGANISGISNSPDSNPLSYLNPADIESVQILKDASATAIYGSRGSNGVVLITTKKGSIGAPTVEFNSSFGISVLANQPDNLSASEYRTALSDYGLSAGDFGTTVDAFDEITRDVAITKNQSVSFGSGTEKASYRLSMGYFNQEGIVKNSELDRINANLNASFKFLEDDKLKVDVGLVVSQTEEITPPVGTSSGATGSLISAALGWNPTRALYNPDGTFFQLGASSINNPVALLAGTLDESTQLNIVGRISPSYQITKNLLYKIDYGVTKVAGKRSGYLQKWLQAGSTAGRGFAFINSELEDNVVLTHTLNYNKQFDNDLSLNLLAGYEWQRNSFESVRISGTDFDPEFLDYRGFFHTVPTVGGSREYSASYSPNTNLQSYFGRANLNIKDRYLLTATMRADGSNKFGSDNQYGYFPSAAFAWNITNEEFLDDGPFSNLKLRLSWGQTGNQSFSSTASATFFNLGTTLENNVSVPTLVRQNAANPSLKWETTTSFNVGLDFGVLAGRLRGSVDYFDRTTDDLLFRQAGMQPAPLGSIIWVNLTDSQVTNKGVELDLSGDIISNENFNWSAGLNATYVENNLKDFEGNVDYGELFGPGLSSTTSQRLEEGQPLNSFYLPVFTGTDVNGVDQFLVAEGDDPTRTQDHIKEFVGNSNPDVIVGFSTNFSLGKWSAALNFNGVFGHQLLYNTPISFGNISNLGSQNISRIENGLNPSNSPYASSKYIFDGDYVKLSNATLTYTIGDYLSIKNIQIYCSGNNLFTITNYPGVDPEVNTINEENGLPSNGIEYEAYPTVTTILIGTKFSL